MKNHSISQVATTFTNLISNSTYSYIHYCFKSVPGFSKIGSYTGNGSTQSITGVGFQPNLLIIKQTDGVNSWRIFDSARGLSAPQTLFVNLDFAEDSESNTVSSFDSDGWTMGSQQGVNDNGDCITPSIDINAFSVLRSISISCALPDPKLKKVTPIPVPVLAFAEVNANLN